MAKLKLKKLQKLGEGKSKIKSCIPIRTKEKRKLDYWLT